MAVITISRQFASGGDEIAIRICELLNYRYFDKRLMAEVVSQVGISENEIVDISEEGYQARPFLARLLRAHSATVARVAVRQRDAAGAVVVTSRDLEMEDCVELVRSAILAAHELDNVVIVGRGGQAILHDQPGVLHVRVVAPLANRIERLRAQGMTGVADIKASIQQADHASADYLRRFFQVQWDDAERYHLLLNTGLLSTDAAAQIVVAAVQAM